ncbi:MAG: hypothetical protein IPL78_11830 [Chloroflexi bacterium]|nr:hypothetical protein [Chloroflexota bacterium]
MFNTLHKHFIQVKNLNYYQTDGFGKVCAAIVPGTGQTNLVITQLAAPCQARDLYFENTYLRKPEKTIA